MTVLQQHLSQIDWVKDPGTKHHLWVQERVQDGDLPIKRVPTAKNWADVAKKPVSSSVLQTTLQICRIGRVGLRTLVHPYPFDFDKDALTILMRGLPVT